MSSRPPPRPADPRDNPAALVPHHHHRHHPILLAAFAAVTAITFLALAAAVLVVLLYRRLARGGAPSSAPADLKIPAASHLRRFSYSQLRRATASFSPSHKLGQGGFGPVFRGALPSGQEIAVKVMNFGSLQGEREFQNELTLARKMLAMGSSPDRKWVVAPVGYCSSEERHRSRRWWRRRRWREADEEEEEEEVVEASADGRAAGRRLLLVYELMHNGSLQDALLDRRCPELMDWSRRFSVALDIARGLQFLHVVCDPPVIHGDIKPSNILLDARLSAKIADFGLARLKTPVADEPPIAAAIPASNLGVDEVVIEIELDKSVANDSKSFSKDKQKEPAGGGGEDDASITEETTESTTTTTGFDESINGCGNGVIAPEKSPEEDEVFTTASLVETAAALDVASTSETGVGFDKMSVDSGKGTAATSSRRGGRKKSGVGKDWWWRQDAGGGANSESGGSVKDYVMEWIRSEIKKERPKSDWMTASTSSLEDCLPKPSGGGRSERRKRRRRMEWWVSLDEEKSKKKKVKSRPAREWWREEFCEELTNKQKRRAMGKSEMHWWQKDEDFASPLDGRKGRRKKSWSLGSRTSMDRWIEGIGGETRTAGRRSSQDWASGDIPKSGGTVSSTPSMRGTVCYAAPECGGGGLLSEKCDIYSFGVLLLVLISGRRPLQVTASPMSEFERANLISWARHLAHLGRLLDLLDPSLRAVDREQALLCITVALLCLQRAPARRPSIKVIIGMLTGQSEPPHLPLEFSPSPPGGFSFKSRKKTR